MRFCATSFFALGAIFTKLFTFGYSADDLLDAVGVLRRVRLAVQVDAVADHADGDAFDLAEQLLDLADDLVRVLLAHG